jgi:hypothetical protein
LRELPVERRPVIGLRAAEVAGSGGVAPEEGRVLADVLERRLRFEQEQVVRHEDAGLAEAVERALELPAGRPAREVLLSGLRRILDAHEHANDPELPELAREGRGDGIGSAFAHDAVAMHAPRSELALELPQARQAVRRARQEQRVVVETEEASFAACGVMEGRQLRG